MRSGGRRRELPPRVPSSEKGGRDMSSFNRTLLRQVQRGRIRSRSENVSMPKVLRLVAIYWYLYLSTNLISTIFRQLISS